MTKIEYDWEVVVCASCLMSSCWLYIHLCDDHQHADLTTRKASELRALGREHEDYFAPEFILKHTGSLPKPVRT